MMVGQKNTDAVLCNNYKNSDKTFGLDGVAEERHFWLVPVKKGVIFADPPDSASVGIHQHQL